MTSEKPNLCHLTRLIADDTQLLGVPDEAPLDVLSAEQTILGFLIMNAKEAYIAYSDLKPAMFERPVHKSIFAACFTLLAKGIEPEANLIFSELPTNLKTSEIQEYIGDLVLSVGIPSLGFTQAVIQVIKSNYIKRRLLILAQEMPRAANEMKAEEMLASISKFITDLAQLGKEKTNKSKTEVLANVIKQLLNPDDKEIQGIISIGYPVFEQFCNYFRRNQLIMIAAPTGHGKTVLALNIALNAAKLGHKVLFLSLEMGQEEVFTRAFMAKIRPRDKKAITSEQAHKAAKELEDIALEVLFTPTCTLSDIRMHVEYFERTNNGIDMLIVDYLGLVSHEDGQFEPDHIRTAKITKGLKNLAGQKNMVVICPAQYTRDGSKGEVPKHRLLYEIKGGGATSADADKVICITSDMPEADAPIKEFYMAKNRLGTPNISHQVAFYSKHLLFEEFQANGNYFENR